MAALPANILNTVAGSMVATQKYPSKEAALWELARTAARGRISQYRRRIRRFESKHSTDFDKFTARLKNRATPAEEDDWLAWKSARRMLLDWEKAYRALEHAQSR